MRRSVKTSPMTETTTNYNRIFVTLIRVEYSIRDNEKITSKLSRQANSGETSKEKELYLYKNYVSKNGDSKSG